MKTPVVLASSSPRRRELLGALGWSFEAVVPSADETRLPGETPEQLVQRLAAAKARSVAPCWPGCWIIGSDTVVVCDGEIFGKPHSDDEAAAMLSRLSGRWHEVCSGLALISPHGEAQVGLDRTRVHVKPLAEADIAAYVASGEPKGKAGGYAIQGRGSLMVDRIDGNYSTVVGLPMALLADFFVLQGGSLSKLWEV